jgi:hypothetical protein
MDLGSIVQKLEYKSFDEKLKIASSDDETDRLLDDQESGLQKRREYIIESFKQILIRVNTPIDTGRLIQTPDILLREESNERLGTGKLVATITHDPETDSMTTCVKFKPTDNNASEFIIENENFNPVETRTGTTSEILNYLSDAEDTLAMISLALRNKDLNP